MVSIVIDSRGLIGQEGGCCALGERNVVHGKVWVSRVLGSVQKGPTRELEALAGRKGSFQ